jgi:hypothetical protein
LSVKRVVSPRFPRAEQWRKCDPYARKFPARTSQVRRLLGAARQQDGVEVLAEILYRPPSSSKTVQFGN